MTHWVDWRPGQYHPFPAPVTPPSSGILDGAGFCLPLSRDWLPVILGALNTLTVPATWTTDAERAEQEVERLRAWLMAAFYPCVTDPVTGEEITVPTCCEDGKGGASYPDCEDCEKETMPQIIMIGGKGYLPRDCGCGDTQMFPLGQPVSVTIDPDTGEAKIPSSAPIFSGTVADEFKTVTADAQDCYASKAVPYLLARVLEFVETTQTIMTTGLDFVAGGVDEFLDLGTIVTDLLGDNESGIINAIRGFDEADITAAFEDPAFEAVMIDRWTADGPVYRLGLWDWAISAPEYWEADGHQAVPVRTFMQNWVQSSIILAYNKQLKVYAAECETGRTLDDVNQDQIERQGYQDVEYLGNTYRVWSFDNLDVVLDNAEYYLVDNATFDGYSIGGIYADYAIENSGAVNVLMGTRAYQQYAGSLSAGTYAHGMQFNAAATPVIESITGSDYTIISNGSGGLSDPGIGNHDRSLSAVLRLSAFYVVGIPA